MVLTSATGHQFASSRIVRDMVSTLRVLPVAPDTFGHLVVSTYAHRDIWVRIGEVESRGFNAMTVKSPLRLEILGTAFPAVRIRSVHARDSTAPYGECKPSYRDDA